MPKANINDFLAFLAVARERSFTRAAAKVGVSQSALSHTIRQLEARLGIRLLTRTTRSVSTTEAGERLLQKLGPRFEEIETEIEALSELREKPAGLIRITTSDYAIETIIRPKLKKFLPRYPDIKVELIIDYGLTDIVSERFDAGVRFGEQVAKDMISVRIGPDVRFIVVGAKSYFNKHPKPVTPEDLTNHSCIALRFPTYGGLYAWELEKDGREVRVRTEGQLIFNSIFQVLSAAVDGHGVAHVPRHRSAVSFKRQARPCSGRLVSALGRVSSLLSEPPAVVPGFHSPRGRFTTSWMMITPNETASS